MTLTDTLLARAALRALREWLFELGHENATIGSVADGSPGVYHLPGVGRLVRVRTTIAPSYPESLCASEIRALRTLARRLDARAWEARIIVRPNFHPSALIWRNLEPTGQRTRAAWLGRYGLRSSAFAAR